MSTKSRSYTRRLATEQLPWWKTILDVQAPYRWNLRRLKLGFTLDIGCGIGRNLINLSGHGVGVDHNRDSVETAKSRGLNAFTPEGFRDSDFNVANLFDSILLAHVAEHMTEFEGTKLLSDYLYLLKPQGKVVLITPQEAGFRSDPTHVTFTDFYALRRISSEVGLAHAKEYSFPFPRAFGRFFKHNEFVSVSTKPAQAA